MRALYLVPSRGDDRFAVLHCRCVDRMQAENQHRMVYSGATAILSLRCWALFGGNYRILVVLIALYACCLGVQIVSQNRFTIANRLIQGVEVPNCCHIQPARDVYPGNL